MIDVGVPLAVTLTQFPVWVHRNSESTISGLFLIFAFLCCIPFFRQIKEFVKNPSAPIVWLVLLVLFVLLRNIIDEMVWVCFFGTIANLIGTVIYKIGTAVAEKEEASEEETEEVT
jgi:hypothetical protein